jgi:benzylsuccinate CoA-transferase BbsF subunit
MGNRSPSVPHGIFPCAGDDRWISLAVYTEPEWASLAQQAGLARPEWATMEGRRADVDALEAALAAWTSTHDALTLAEHLQSLGLEAVPVADFGDASADPQLRFRGHFVELDHPILGPGEYERNGIRVSGAPCGYLAPTPLLGQHTDEVLAEVLGLGDGEIGRLRESGAIQ